MGLVTERHGNLEAGEIIVQNAPQEAVDLILNAPVTGLDGRSQWVWIRLPPDGDLVLAVFPQGDTYFNTEHLRSI